jgi:hypothetical protein
MLRDEIEQATEKWNSRASRRNREEAVLNSRARWSEKHGMGKTLGSRDKLGRDEASEAGS